jgi:large conductance mechanosensitive channel
VAESSPTPVKKSLKQEFFDFLMIFGIIGLAIAFVIGQAASKLVTSFVNDIITPFIGLFLPAGNLNAVKFTIENSTFMVGDLIANIINFLIIAFIVFLAYKQLSRFKLVEDKTKPAPADKK